MGGNPQESHYHIVVEGFKIGQGREAGTGREEGLLLLNLAENEEADCAPHTLMDQHTRAVPHRNLLTPQHLHATQTQSPINPQNHADQKI